MGTVKRNGERGSARHAVAREAGSEERENTAPTEVMAGQGKRPIKYKTTPRWTRKMLEGRRNAFLDAAMRRNNSDAAVWKVLKRYLEALVPPPSDETTAPDVDVGTIDSKLGVVSHGGISKRSKETGGMLYHYKFSD